MITDIKVTLKTIGTGCQYLHEIDREHRQAIMDAMAGGAEMPPVLAVEDLGNGARILDGHHRADAAMRLGMRTIEAWVVSESDWIRWCEETGTDPTGISRLSDIDDAIILPDGSRYSDGHREDHE